jgi:hypothetical protein
MPALLPGAVQASHPALSSSPGQILLGIVSLHLGQKALLRNLEYKS